ncbi:hypothetical protein ACLMAL_26545 [Nocardia sp. CWNU-33]|uniref:hypothetical protein n=1 Tax=Nocardia sp. CWNU-33 TaxID=3392117 RepID=UPI00398E89F0
MARFRLEAHAPIPGHGTLTIRLELPDLDDLIEHARLWVLQDQLHTQQIRIYDRSAELLAVDGAGGPLVVVIDEWANARESLCPECGELRHAARIDSGPAWYCHGCNDRAQAA